MLSVLVIVSFHRRINTQPIYEAVLTSELLKKIKHKLNEAVLQCADAARDNSGYWITQMGTRITTHNSTRDFKTCLRLATDDLPFDLRLRCAGMTLSLPISSHSHMLKSDSHSHASQTFLSIPIIFPYRHSHSFRFIFPITLVQQQYLGNGNSYSSILHGQSVSQWNAWPAMGRSALQDLRSCAILQASLELSPVSSSICCTHVRQCRPRWRFHSGLMSGLPPVRACTARRSAEWAGVASGSRRT